MLILQLAKKFLLSDEKKSFRTGIIIVATMGVLFACLAVTVTLGVLSGYQRVHKEAVLNFGTHLIIFRQDGLTRGEQDAIASFLKKTPIKNIFTAYQLFEALAPTQKGLRPIIFKGVDPAVMQEVYRVSFQPFSSQKPENVFVGKPLLDLQRNAYENQSIKYLVVGAASCREDKLPENCSGRDAPPTRTRYADISIDGTFDSGFYDFDSRFILMPLTQLQELFFDVPSVSGFEVRLRDVNQVDDLRDAFVEEFGPDFDVITWDELNAGLFETLKLERTVVVAVAFLVLVIACLNIFGFNFLFFIERRREFMILNAMGLGLRKLRRLLVLLSLFLGGMASAVGMLLGLGILVLMQQGKGIPLNPEVYFIDRIPVHFEACWFLIALVGSLVLCWLTSFVAGRVVLKRFSVN